MRYVEWNVEVLYELLQKVVIARTSKYNLRPRLTRSSSSTLDLFDEEISRVRGFVVDKITDSIEMPHGSMAELREGFRWTPMPVVTNRSK